jgi:type II secretory pathway pseudopilin PulG
MSNVLIGIIGVILFIGLALAGALFLGPRFQESTNNSKASAAVQAVAQVAHAANMYEVNNGKFIVNSLTDVDDLKADGFLKATPVNPVVASNTPFTIASTGGLSPTRPSFVLMYLGQTTVARDVCIAVEKQMGKTDRLDPALMEEVTDFFQRAGPGKSGCHRNRGSFGSNGGQAGDYLIYYSI